MTDLRAALYVLVVFGYFSGLRVSVAKTVALVRCVDQELVPPASVAGVTVKKSVKQLGVLLGNVRAEEAYALTIAKMLASGRTLASLPLGMEARAFLFAFRVAPIVYLTARAYAPIEHVVSQLRWVPSHLKGNDGADELAMQGRLLHPNNLLLLSKRRCVLEWDELGLEPMQRQKRQMWTRMGVDQWRGNRPALPTGMHTVPTSVTLACAYPWTVTVRGSARMSVTPAESASGAGWDAPLPVSAPPAPCDRVEG